MKKYLLAFLTILSPLLTFAQEAEEMGLDQQIDQAFAPVSEFVTNVIFFLVWEDRKSVV